MPARAAGVWLSITSLARDEGAAVAVRHAVIACGVALGAEAALLLATDHRPYEPVFATGPRSDELTDVQATLGEGRAVEAGNGHGPVLGADLRTLEAQTRWPEFVPVALANGVTAVFAVPVGSGAARLGVLCLYRDRPQELTRDQLDTVLLYADAAMILALDDRGGIAPGSAELIGVSFSERRAEVHQATGMVSVQLGISVTDALVTLRAHAYAEGRPVAEIAADVVTRRFAFSASGNGFPSAGAPGKAGPQPPKDGSAPRLHGPAPPGPPDQEQDHDQNRADNNEEMEGE